MRAELLAMLELHVSALANFQRQLKRSQQTQVRAAALKEAAASLARQWFHEIVPALQQVNFAEQTITQFSEQFGELLCMSRTAARTNAYLRLLSALTATYRGEIIHQIEVRSFSPGNALSISPYVEGLPPEEGAYLDEAQRCLTVNGIRACIVLGWCATISRMHQKIAATGFDSFNKATKEMAAKQSGRFKPFNKKFEVESISELERTVFDTDLLWVLEYMELIDSNQHERLRHCFTLRNNSAHPGKAPITGENLYSFYSDITQIVLKNPKFAVPSSA